MLTESELFALKVLKLKFDQNANLYFSAKEIGEDVIFQNRSTPTYRPGMCAGVVLSNLRRKALIDLVLFVEDVTAPIRLYRINSNGIRELEQIKDLIHIEQERLEKSCQIALEYVESCMVKLKGFKEQHGLV
jgi:hypothetical protein